MLLAYYNNTTTTEITSILYRVQVWLNFLVFLTKKKKEKKNRKSKCACVYACFYECIMYFNERMYVCVCLCVVVYYCFIKPCEISRKKSNLVFTS